MFEPLQFQDLPLPLGFHLFSSHAAALRPGVAAHEHVQGRTVAGIGRILVTWGSRRGGTEGIAHQITDVLTDAGFVVTALPVEEVADIDAFDAVVLGGALYVERWHPAALRFANTHTKALRQRPVWLFSSGPLDDSATRHVLPPVPEVALVMAHIGALDHMTFGGRLEAALDSAVAGAAGDWRDPAQVDAWAHEIAERLPTARPGAVVEPGAHSTLRLLTHGFVGWAVLAVVLASQVVIPVVVAKALRAALGPFVFVAVSMRYFGAVGARAPWPTARSFLAEVVVLDLIFVAGLGGQGLGLFADPLQTWLPYLLIFCATGLSGVLTAAVRPGPSPRM